MTLGSLFDGIGGFPLAAVHNGIVPLWASEIEPFPMSVTRIRFPQMVHVGDITKLNGARLPLVDIICGGSPCQDLSVAGQRRGLAGERSGLFMDQIRIVKEMRDADEQRGLSDHLVRPRYLVWENVPGAFSSAKGEDFRAVIEEIVHIKDCTCYVPRPDTGRWEPAGAAILGNEFSLAWRVADAQFWGLAQRRRRIFLVADFGGLTAPEILFKQNCLFGDTPKDQGSRSGTSGTTQDSTNDPGGGGGIKEGNPVPVICLNDQGGERMDATIGITGTLRAGMSGHPPLVLENGSVLAAGVVTKGNGDCFLTPEVHTALTGGGGQAGQGYPCVLTMEMATRSQVLSGSECTDSGHITPHRAVPPIPACYREGNENGSLSSREAESFCIAGNIIGRETQNGGNGLGYQQNLAYTLTGMDRHAVLACYPGSEYVSGEGGKKRNRIRRLTPLECERLQGFPDGWTDVPGASDSARYKALGNSVAVPCVDFILCGIAYFLSKAETKGMTDPG